MIISGLFALFLAISIDTDFYTPFPVTWSRLFSHPMITPLNNLKYNLKKSNLALHGLHPRYQHLVTNLPQLLGPAFILLFLRPHRSLRWPETLARLEPGHWGRRPRPGWWNDTSSYDLPHLHTQ